MCDARAKRRTARRCGGRAVTAAAAALALAGGGGGPADWVVAAVDGASNASLPATNWATLALGATAMASNTGFWVRTDVPLKLSSAGLQDHMHGLSDSPSYAAIVGARKRRPAWRRFPSFRLMKTLSRTGRARAERCAPRPYNGSSACAALQAACMRVRSGRPERSRAACHGCLGCAVPDVASRRRAAPRYVAARAAPPGCWSTLACCDPSRRCRSTVGTT